jgi:hypothetical protein
MSSQPEAPPPSPVLTREPGHYPSGHEPVWKGESHLDSPHEHEEKTCCELFFDFLNKHFKALLTCLAP